MSRKIDIFEREWARGIDRDGKIYVDVIDDYFSLFRERKKSAAEKWRETGSWMEDDKTFWNRDNRVFHEPRERALARTKTYGIFIYRPYVPFKR